MKVVENSQVGRGEASSRRSRVISPLHLQRAGAIVLRYGLVAVLILWGTAKWTRAEAEGIQPLVAHSPFLSWIYSVMTVQHGSELIGIAELLFAVLIALRRWFPKLSAAGSAGCIVMFLITLSFLFTTPALDEGTKGFLIKDVFLLGASVWSTGEAWQTEFRKRN